MKKIKIILNLIGVICLVLFLSQVVLAADSPAGANPAKKVAIVFHGENVFHVDYYKNKLQIKKTSMAVGTGLLGVIAGPGKKSKNKAEELDQNVEISIQPYFMDYSYVQDFTVSFFQALRLSAQQQVKMISSAENYIYPQVNSSFYSGADKAYQDKKYKLEAQIQDYTALQGEGVRYVYDVTIKNTIGPSSGLGKKTTPLIIGQVVLLDLYNRSVVSFDRIFAISDKYFNLKIDEITNDPQNLKKKEKIMTKVKKT